MAPSPFTAQHRLLSLALLALSALTLAAPTPTTPPVVPAFAHNTPTATLSPPQFDKRADDEMAALINRMAAAARASVEAKSTRRNLDSVLDVNMLVGRDFAAGDDTLIKRAAGDCLDSTADDSTINSLFHYGGDGTVVLLCPGTTLTITNPIFFSAPRQTLATQGELPMASAFAVVLR